EPPQGERDAAMDPGAGSGLRSCEEWRVRVSVAVMAHPDRAGFVDELCGRLDRDPTVVWDEIGDVWHTGRRAMLAYDPDADYHLVIQDDAVVCRDLVAGVEKALEYVERRRTLNLYMGESKRPALNE